MCVYVTYEGIPDMWTKYTFEHPALTGVFGMLPSDGVEMETFKRTLSKVCGDDVWRVGWIGGRSARFPEKWQLDSPLRKFSSDEITKMMCFLGKAGMEISFFGINRLHLRIHIH